jgi:hypothetical protein
MCILLLLLNAYCYPTVSKKKPTEPTRLGASNIKPKTKGISQIAGLLGPDIGQVSTDIDQGFSPLRESTLLKQFEGIQEIPLETLS